ncbi:PAS domain S-box protein, partial [Azospirillum brasilense]|nr:PAS domain S-box protein [Azospirillum brasilense]
MAGAGDIVAVLSSDGRFIDVGSAGLGGLGIPPEALLGTPVLERVHPDDREEAVRRLARCGHGTSGENGGPCLCRVRHAAGGWRHMETTAFNRPDDPKIRGIVIHARDVTDRVETEQRLRASEALYQTLARSAPVGIFQTDRDGGIVFANPRFAAIAGLSSDALSGHAWRASLHPEDRTRLEADWAQAVAAGLPVLLNLRFCATDGTITFALCQGSPLTDADGRVQGWVGPPAGLAAQLGDRRGPALGWGATGGGVARHACWGWGWLQPLRSRFPARRRVAYRPRPPISRWRAGSSAPAMPLLVLQVWAPMPPPRLS